MTVLHVWHQTAAVPTRTGEVLWYVGLTIQGEPAAEQAADDLIAYLVTFWDLHSF